MNGAAQHITAFAVMLITMLVCAVCMQFSVVLRFEQCTHAATCSGDICTDSLVVFYVSMPTECTRLWHGSEAPSVQLMQHRSDCRHRQAMI